MSKKKIRDVQKNSKQVALVSKEETKVKFTPETTAVVTIKEPGAFKTRESNAGTKEQKEKMKASWIYLKVRKGDDYVDDSGKTLRPGEYQSKDGVKWYPLKPGKMPNNYYEGPKSYNPPQYHECLKQIKINAEAVQYYISDEACPGRSKKERAEWSTLSKYERFVRNAIVTAEGNEIVSIKIVN